MIEQDHSYLSGKEPERTKILQTSVLVEELKRLPTQYDLPWLSSLDFQANSIDTDTEKASQDEIDFTSLLQAAIHGKRLETNVLVSLSNDLFCLTIYGTSGRVMRQSKIQISKSDSLIYLIDTSLFYYQEKDNQLACLEVNTSGTGNKLNEYLYILDNPKRLNDTDRHNHADVALYEIYDDQGRETIGKKLELFSQSQLSYDENKTLTYKLHKFSRSNSDEMYSLENLFEKYDDPNDNSKSSIACYFRSAEDADIQVRMDELFPNGEKCISVKQYHVGLEDITTLAEYVSTASIDGFMRTNPEDKILEAGFVLLVNSQGNLLEISKWHNSRHQQLSLLDQMTTDIAISRKNQISEDDLNFYDGVRYSGGGVQSVTVYCMSMSLFLKGTFTISLPGNIPNHIIFNSPKFQPSSLDESVMWQSCN